MEDVNLDAASASGAGNIEPNQMPEAQSQQAEPAPAEAKNTDQAQDAWEFPKDNPGWPKGVYERFNNVNQKLQEAEKQLNDYKAKQGLYQTAEAFDQFLVENPDVAEEVKKIIEEKNKAQFQNNNFSSEQAVHNIDPRIINTLQSFAKDKYESAFNDFCKNNSISDDLKPYVQGIAENFLVQYNPDPLNNYNGQAALAALNSTKDFLDKFFMAKQKDYVQNKSQANIPASSSSRSGPAIRNDNSGPKSQSEKARILASAMKEGQRVF